MHLKVLMQSCKWSWSVSLVCHRHTKGLQHHEQMLLAADRTASGESSQLLTSLSQPATVTDLYQTVVPIKHTSVTIIAILSHLITFMRYQSQNDRQKYQAYNFRKVRSSRNSLTTCTNTKHPSYSSAIVVRSSCVMIGSSKCSVDEKTGAGTVVKPQLPKSDLSRFTKQIASHVSQASRRRPQRPEPVEVVHAWKHLSQCTRIIHPMIPWSLSSCPFF